MSRIPTRFAELMRSGLNLGTPVGGEQALPRVTRGFYQLYSQGAIYDNPALPQAYEVHGAIFAHWQMLGLHNYTSLNYPGTNEMTCPDGVGKYNHFYDAGSGTISGSIYWHPRTRAFEVHGAIRELWLNIGAERSSMGYPISNEENSPEPGGKVSRFERGYICWDGRGAYEVFSERRITRLPDNQGGNWRILNSHVVSMHMALINLSGIPYVYSWGYDHTHDDRGITHTDTRSFGLSEFYRYPFTSRSLAGREYVDAVSTTYVGTQNRMPNIFCAGQALMADGRLFIAGGDREVAARMRAMHIFDPFTRRLTFLGNTREGRWYCNVTCLHNGKMIIIAGEKREVYAGTPNNTYELFDPATNSLSAPVVLPHIGSRPQPGAPYYNNASYPFVFVLPNRQLFIHAGRDTRLMDLQTMSVGATNYTSSRFRTYGLEGTSVLLPLIKDAAGNYPCKVLMMGAGENTIRVRDNASNSTELFDANQPAAGWVAKAPMLEPRVMPDAVILPTGKILVMNGSSTGYADNGANPVYNVEQYDPAANRWEYVNPMTTPRLYHATALLLPDGKVLVGGSDGDWNPGIFHINQTAFEIYSPSYTLSSLRPVITQCPPTIAYNKVFEIQADYEEELTGFCLIRCGSVTHSFNSDQRYIEIYRAPAPPLEPKVRGRDTVANSKVIQSGNIPVYDPSTIVQPPPPSVFDRPKIKLMAPPDGFIAPPGMYMLFIKMGNEISEAKLIKLG